MTGKYKRFANTKDKYRIFPPRSRLNSFHFFQTLYINAKSNYLQKLHISVATSFALSSSQASTLPILKLQVLISVRLHLRTRYIHIRRKILFCLSERFF